MAEDNWELLGYIIRIFLFIMAFVWICMELGLWVALAVTGITLAISD